MKGAIEKVTLPISGIMKMVSMAVLFAIMMLTATDVLLRYILKQPIMGTIEIVEFMMAVLISFGLAFCALDDGHVSVDLLVKNFSIKKQKIIDCVTSFISFVFFTLITWQNIIYIKDNYLSKLESPVLLLPVYPFIALTAMGLAALTLALLLVFIRNLSNAVTK